MARKPHQKRKRHQSAKHDAEVAAELNEVNAILQDDERSQKETWQIGKRLKQLMETHPKMSKRQTVDAFFLWGTALARLAAQNDDAMLAHAAADKFHEMHTLSRGDDAAIGAVGYSLWASSLLIMATEQQSREVLDQALEKFQQAVNVDGGTTFETRFQYARALKEGGDMVKFLETEAAGGEEGTKTEHRQYYERALVLCGELEKIYEEEQSKQKQPAAEDGETNGGEEKEEDEDQSEDDEDEENADEEEEEEEEEELLFHGDEDEVDPEDDVVNVADLAEVKLLSAILHGVLEEDTTAEQAVATVDRTLALFAEAQALDEENPGVLMELANYVALKGKQRQRNRALDSVEWDTVIDGLNAKVTLALARVEFPMAECKEICFRKDTQQEEEPKDEERTDAQVPHLLHALGKALVAYLMGEAAATDASAAAKAPKQATLAELKKMGKIQGTGGGFLSKVNKGKLAQLNSKTGKKHPRFQHTVHVLRSAHHFHDKLGCYPLAVLFAHPSYLDEAQCQVWLETAESYGVLDEELQLEHFSAVWARPWFTKFTQPVEQVDVEQEAEAAQA